MCPVRMKTSPRKKALTKTDKLIEKYSREAKQFNERAKWTAPANPRDAAELKEIAKAFSMKAEKGRKLREKIIQGMKTKKGTYSVKELTGRAKPWAERINNNRNFMLQLANYEREAVGKLVKGKRVTRNELEIITNIVRDYRGVILGETKYLRR